jgi:hypothetical protein
MPGTLRVRGYRQREAGARSRYSHRDLYGGADDQARRFSAAYWHCSVYFPGLAVAVVLCVSGIAQKGTTAMTVQLPACMKARNHSRTLAARHARSRARSG